MLVWEKHRTYQACSIARGFRDPQAVLEHVPVDKGAAAFVWIFKSLTWAETEKSHSICWLQQFKKEAVGNVWVGSGHLGGAVGPRAEARQWESWRVCANTHTPQNTRTTHPRTYTHTPGTQEQQAEVAASANIKFRLRLLFSNLVRLEAFSSSLLKHSLTKIWDSSAL